MQIKDKLVAITGAGKGIGRAMAQAALFIVENDYFSGRVLELDGGLRM